MTFNAKKYLQLSMVITLFVVTAIVYYKFNPADNGWFPRCPVKLLTGWSCPGCGTQRAMHALLNGNIYEALRYNYFFVISIPYVLALVLSLVLKRQKKHGKISHYVEGQPLVVLYIVCFCSWFVIRNIFEI